MFEVILFNFKNRALVDCMDEINTFLLKTSFDVVSVSHGINHDGCLEVLICLKDDLEKDAEGMIRNPQVTEE